MRRALVVLLMVGCSTEVNVQGPGGGQVVGTAVEPPGANCPNGGVAISTGHDDNGNGVLDADEVSATTYACTAPNELVRIVDEPPGVNCAAGGQALESGADADGDGVLEDSEVTSTSYVCAAAQALIRLDVEPPGTNCAHGGTAVRSGVDVNDDGTLEGAEVTSTSFVCVPPSTLQQLVAVVPASTVACPGGGQTVEVGFDLDADGVLDAGEISSVTNVCGGISTLVVVDPEPAGANCAAGGSRITTGEDLDHDGVLDPGEVQSVRFACNPSTTINGDVVLHVQADVDALAGVEVITGNLLIDTFTLTALRLPSLQSVRSFGCTGPCPLHDVEFPALETGIVVLQGTFTVIDIGNLRSGTVDFANEFRFSGTSFDFPLLESGSVTIIDTGATLTSVTAPRLNGNLFVCDCAALTHLDLAAMTGPAEIDLVHIHASDVQLPALANGTLRLIQSTTSFLDLPSFTTGQVFVSEAPVKTFALGQLASGFVSISKDPALVELDLPRFTSGALGVDNAASFQKFDVPALEHLDGIFVMNDPKFPTCVALAMWEAFGFPSHDISGDDDSATCP